MPSSAGSRGRWRTKWRPSPALLPSRRHGQQRRSGASRRRSPGAKCATSRPSNSWRMACRCATPPPASGWIPGRWRRWRELGHAPLWDRHPSGSILDPFRAHLERRWAEGCGNARQLWRELVGLGFGGRPSIVRVWAGRRRKADACAGVPSPGQVPRSRRWKPPSIHKLTRLLTAGPGERSEPDRLLCDRLLAQQPNLAAAVTAARRLAGLLRKEGTGKLVDVLKDMATTPLARFGEGLERDAIAIENALELPWTTSPVEGQVNRIKTVKRAMYGRAGFDLLRRRVLLAA